MNIVIINGSPRKNGATAKILRTMEQNLLTKENITVEYVEISDLKMAACAGCCSCYKTGHCFINDDAEILSNKIEAADGLIIGSPTYASNVSGQLKQFIDRGHFVIEQLLHNKYAISIATGENYGINDASKVLVKLIKYSGARLSGKIICKIPFNGNPTNNIKFRNKLLNCSDKIYNDILLKKTYPFQLIAHKIIFQVGIRPFVENKGESHKGVISRWKKNQIFNIKIE